MKWSETVVIPIVIIIIILLLLLLLLLLLNYVLFKISEFMGISAI